MASTIQALIQAAATSPAGSTNRVLGFSQTVNQGDLLVAAVSWTAPTGQPTISDTQSNSWIEIGQIASILNGNMVSLILFWAVASASGANTVTASVAGITTPTNVWLAIAEFSGANSLAIISGSTLGYGVNPPLGGEGPQSGVIQATNPPLTTPTGALLVMAATTSAATATWSVDVQNNWFSIAAQGGGIVLAYALNLYTNAPFCDMTPPEPILDRSGDSSTQWVALTAPFTTTTPSPQLSAIQSFEIQKFQYPAYPYNLPQRL